MPLWSGRSNAWKALLGAAVLGVTGTLAQAQAPAPAEEPSPIVVGIDAAILRLQEKQATQESPIVPCSAASPALPSLSPSPSGCCVPCPSPTTTLPSMVPSTPSGTEPTPTPSDEGAFRSVTSGAGYGANTAVGYIDSAIPLTQLRVRFDAAWDDNEPDRAAFFYAKCGCFPGAPGPGPNPNSRVNYQELSTCLEYALNERFSTFFEVPLRFIQTTSAVTNANNGDFGGFSDIDFGFKYALLMDPCQVGTFQFRTYAPTGDPHEGLGNNLWVLEPAFLYYRQLSKNWTLEAELRDWIPVATTDDFAGNIIRYGVGLSYHLYSGPSFRVTPVGEVVGWTCLSGKELDLESPGGFTNAVGDTIVNLKIGARLALGDGVSPGWLNQSDLYVGYGHAVTNDIWYRNIVRAEFRLRF
jgi:hypothetical protein